MLTHPTIHQHLAHARASDLALRARTARRGKERRVPTTLASEVVLRDARPDDMTEVARLAALDGRAAPEGRTVVAAVCGRIRAAVDTRGQVVADPFEATEDLVRLLQLRARQLRA